MVCNSSPLKAKYSSGTLGGERAAHDITSCADNRAALIIELG